ncbi:hypothetical protein VTN00DRAFT_372 [Thermoascus crustaceus]|uniref:uncharacterized protein n=1 Tax=Thermoascus crustaceus TaxID=5088 RepID=UPI0037425806
MHLAFCYLTSRTSSENPTPNRPTAEYRVKIVMVTQAQGKAKDGGDRLKQVFPSPNPSFVPSLDLRPLDPPWGSGRENYPFSSCVNPEQRDINICRRSKKALGVYKQ